MWACDRSAAARENASRSCAAAKKETSICGSVFVQGAQHILDRGPDTDLKRWGEKLASRGGGAGTLSLSHVVDLDIHLRQRFLHVLDMLAGQLPLITAMPHQRPHRAYLAVQSKCRSKQPDRIQIIAATGIRASPCADPVRSSCHGHPPNTASPRVVPAHRKPESSILPCPPSLPWCRHNSPATHLAIASRSSVNVENTRTGFSSRSAGTATKISLAPISMPPAFGSSSGRSSRHIPFRLRLRFPGSRLTLPRQPLSDAASVWTFTRLFLHRQRPSRATDLLP
jgi:hypothetical protein